MSGPPWTGDELRQVFLEQLPLIERIIERVCRRNRCSFDEAEEFAAEVKAAFVEEDYGILRKFQGRCSLSTYLQTVVTNRFLNHRSARWGKWRPSAIARRLGPAAVELELLLSRDGWSLAEAVRKLAEDSSLGLSPEELGALADRLPPRSPRRFVEETEMEALGEPGDAEERIADRERLAVLERVQEAANRALAGFDLEDRFLLRLRFERGWTVRKIAERQRLEPRGLYSRFDRLRRELRREIESRGVTWDDVSRILGWSASRLQIDYGAAGDRSANRPRRAVQPEGGLSRAD